MPFGRYRGQPLSALPSDYLQWLLTLDDLREPLRSSIRDEVARRSGARPDPRIVEDVIAAGQRSLAKRHHPDTGGSHESMLAVRQACEWLFERARELRCLP
jgi:hypothetical protein